MVDYMKEHVKKQSHIRDTDLQIELVEEQPQINKEAFHRLYSHYAHKKNNPLSPTLRKLENDMHDTEERFEELMRIQRSLAKAYHKQKL